MSAPERPSERPRTSIMRDVARLAGVSHQTVSRVLNEHPSVREETRARVLEAMRALNYRRNLAARTLATRRSGILGLVGFESTLYGPASMLYGIEDAARAAGYFVSVVTVRSLERTAVLEAIDRLCAQAVEGIVAIAPKESAANALAEVPDGLGAVGVGGAGESGVASVRFDNRAGAALATQHLLDLGHATVHHVGGPSDWPEARDRIEGWRATLYANDRVVPEAEFGAWTADSGYEIGAALARDPSVTAVFCANDPVALGVLRAMHEAGRRVPDDVSVVGFDDVPEAGYFLPPLTTVRQDFAELGRRSLEVLLDQLREDAPAGRNDGSVLLEPTLTVRGSTGPPS
ncbi:transcriptional regulator [Cryptosporangium arvum DSM 44712]|uniref:Transcriptional regulator n=2 Tax=Cryptosporangium TaxID=65502 RepID=A0A010YMK9_9ACTN|nr:transcriptional regulator [Cryptosporangium arvum DSM 44712]